MKYSLFRAGALILACTAVVSCSDTTGGSSTPIDSVNQAGKSPAAYSEGKPATTTDTTIQGHDARMKDTLGNRAGSVQPNANGANTSNTSDARTTAGSANNGDADKDRKK